MRKFIALLILSVSFMIGGTDQARAEKQMGITGGTDFALASTETMLGDGGSTIGWLPGTAVAEGWGGLSYTQIKRDWEDGWQRIGHGEGVPRVWSPGFACLHVEPVIEIINLVNESQEKANAFARRSAARGLCNYFPGGLTWWADWIVTKMKWSDGDPVYVVKGHATDQDPVYIWLTVHTAEELGFPVPGAVPQPIGLGVGIYDTPSPLVELDFIWREDVGRLSYTEFV